jgi:hypothetical protein
MNHMSDRGSAAEGHDVYQKLNDKKLSSSWCTYYRYVKIIRLTYCTGICTIFMMIVRRVRVCHKLGWDTPKLYFQLLNDSEALIFGVPFFWRTQESDLFIQHHLYLKCWGVQPYHWVQSAIDGDMPIPDVATSTSGLIIGTETMAIHA